jgi:hypothetical protein
VTSAHCSRQLERAGGSAQNLQGCHILILAPRSLCGCVRAHAAAASMRHPATLASCAWVYFLLFDRNHPRDGAAPSCIPPPFTPARSSHHRGSTPALAHLGAAALVGALSPRRRPPRGRTAATPSRIHTPAALQAAVRFGHRRPGIHSRLDEARTQAHRALERRAGAAADNWSTRLCRSNS